MVGLMTIPEPTTAGEARLTGPFPGSDIQLFAGHGKTKKPHAAAQGFRILLCFSFPFNPSDVHLFCHFRAQRGWKGTKTLYSHSMQTNAFRLIFVSPVRSRDEEMKLLIHTCAGKRELVH